MRDLDRTGFFAMARLEEAKAGLQRRMTDDEIEVAWQQWQRCLASGDLSDAALDAHAEAAFQTIQAERGIATPPRN